MVYRWFWINNKISLRSLTYYLYSFFNWQTDLHLNYSCKLSKKKNYLPLKITFIYFFTEIDFVSLFISKMEEFNDRKKHNLGFAVHNLVFSTYNLPFCTQQSNAASSILFVYNFLVIEKRRVSETTWVLVYLESSMNFYTKIKGALQKSLCTLVNFTRQCHWLCIVCRKDVYHLLCLPSLVHVVF